MSTLPQTRRENWLLIGIFCAALIAQFYFTTTNWTSPFMPGHEFRQAQTAIVSYYIDEQNNFSLLYETPIIGKPWVSILLEVPIYEWSVVLLSRATGWPHFMAARAISLTCFYLALPALYLLLGRLALPRPRRLLVLALILTCPVYIFYSRAFLMESMELMCCGWFLLGFVRTMDERRWSWLTLTIIAGTGAALIKSITFAIWLVPAAGYGAWQLWDDLRARRGWWAVLQTILWGAATVAVPLGMLRWWIDFTDPIKAAHASAYIFTAKNLSQGNWGITEVAARVSPKTWKILLERWQEAIMAPWVVGLALVAGAGFFRLVRWRVLGLAAVFFIAQLMFPFAYAYQDYYYYACTVFLSGALGFALCGMLDSRLPRWLVWPLLAIPFIAQVTTYWQGYRTSQILKSNGGFPFTDLLRDIGPKNSVFVIAGADWAAMIPLYARHKALMIRNGLEHDTDYLNRAFSDLADEDVAALILVADQRTNHLFRNKVANAFDMDLTPTFSHPIADVYISRVHQASVRSRLSDSSIKNYSGITVIPKAPDDKPVNLPFKISAALAQASFANVTPAPFQAQFAFGLGHADLDGTDVISAHPDCNLWLHPPANAQQITWDFGIYSTAESKTDGVEFVITGETPTGQRRQIYRRVLDPARHPADHGRQRAVIPYQPRPNETLIFSNRPNLGYAFDWAYWIRIEVK